LERASDMNPGNAVISDHLGDAYWHGGRKNEAVFQWKHALVLKEDSELLNKTAIQEKIDRNRVDNQVLQIKDDTLRNILDKISPNDEGGENK